MPLIIPTFQEYEKSAKQIQDFFVSQRVEYCIYGSFINPGKLRPGLSDIDVFALKRTSDLVFPIEITMTFWEIKTQIESLWIPLQINWCTTWQLENRFFSPDLNYIQEVKRWIDSWIHSVWFENLISQANHRDEINDDSHMARHFHRKWIKLWLNIWKLADILAKEKSEISSDNQKYLWKFWDSFKKMTALYILAIRIKTWESHFSSPDEEILKLFKIYFDISWIDTWKYLEVLKKVRNIEDCYEYLKNWWLYEIIRMYNDIYKPFVKAIWEKFN